MPRAAARLEIGTAESAHLSLTRSRVSLHTVSPVLVP
jgi:hypothetical protein